MARAVTARLFVGDWVPHVHEVADSVDDAVTLLNDGHTVLVPTMELAYDVLIVQGLSPDRAAYHVGI